MAVLAPGIRLPTHWRHRRRCCAASRDLVDRWGVDGEILSHENALPVAAAIASSRRCCPEGKELCAGKRQALLGTALFIRCCEVRVADQPPSGAAVVHAG